ncbi:MAG: hypothetical protein JWP28_3340 [Phenylobacterium sp.]|uniref:hypothetical protein n=1 Tax=Phenylobacterium sp. TaxID=1871053 RepID=UPI00263715A5|nr:hypothetical protein [Phenylobacterium sp.]MDB5499309.1 hypothetical protein [Phenylobacterium sp.]
MSAVLAKSATATVLVGAALGLSACMQSRMSIAEDYGQTVRQHVVAQIADPDAHYQGIPAPGSNGRRVGIAQERYNRNAVIQPASTSTSSASTGGGGGGGGGGPGG